MKIETFWLVCEPHSNSVIEDIVFRTDVVGLANQLKGGLTTEEIIGIYMYENEARCVGNKFLKARDRLKFNLR